jgi:hypothetical protein
MEDQVKFANPLAESEEDPSAPFDPESVTVG